MDIDINALLSSWQISPATHAHILQTQILPRELHPFLPQSSLTTSNHTLDSNPSSHHHHNRHTNRRPLAVFVLGQTGAGKTRLAPLLLSAMTSPSSQTPPTPKQHQQQPASAHAAPVPAPAPSPTPVVHLIADTFKTYHPHYAACLAAAPHLASRLASRDAAGWLRGVCEAAATAAADGGGEGVDVLVESACRRRGDLQSLVAAFSFSSSPASPPPPPPQSQPPPQREEEGQVRGTAARADYRVCVAVLAVPGALSRLGILARYYAGLPEAGSRGLPARLTPRVVHDESYEGLREAVGWVDGEDSGVERVVVVRRNGLVVYADERGEDGSWKKGGGQEGALKALEAERVRGLSADERRAAEEDIAMLQRLGDTKVDKELDEIQGLVAGLGTAEEGLSDLRPLDAEAFISGS